MGKAASPYQTGQASPETAAEVVGVLAEALKTHPADEELQETGCGVWESQGTQKWLIIEL